MNDDYDEHIIQKYRIAVALAVIRNTPENYTPNKYLELLIKNIKPQMDSYDPDMTLCEDDFDINDDAENNRSIADQNANNETQLTDSQTNDSVTILKDFDFNDLINNINNYQDNYTIQSNSVSDVLRILRDDNKDLIEEQVFYTDGDDNILNHTQSTYYKNSENLVQRKNEDMNEDIREIQEFDNTRRGSQLESNSEIDNTRNGRITSISSTDNVILDESQKTNTFHGNTESFTHISQSQVENIALPRYFIERQIPKDTKPKLLDKRIEVNFNEDVSKKVEKKIVKRNKITKQISVNPDAIMTNVKQVNDNKKHKCVTQKSNNTDNIQAKRSRNVEKKTNFITDTEYYNEMNSEANIESIAKSKINSNNISKMEQNEIFKNLFVESDNKDNNSLHDFTEKVDNDLNTVRRDLDNDKFNIFTNFESQTSVESNNKTTKLGYNSQTYSQFSQELDSEPYNNNNKDVTSAVTRIYTDQKTIAEAKEESEEEQIIEDLFDKLTDSQTEVVPFKVLEELNKVKSFLNKQNRRDNLECVPDSGYKSDSQTRSSFKSVLQSSTTWLNQSAHCLLNYITRCPLVVNTEEITKEISRTLGRLIDKLHEDERYPTFLEEYLHTVDCLLKQIYEEESADKLLKKDENIHRLFLLNKSSQIIKYTTEKIISILEDVLVILTKEELPETSLTIQIENLSYVFHILETLIKKLLAYRNFSSQQSTQNSQDEMVLKRSSITDIWRKKWNLAKKCDSESISSVKRCVLGRCSEVLNKIIVQAMDGYSLISYFALQCFNLLQD